MITNPTLTVDAANKLPHGTVRRAPEGFAHAILLDQMGEDAKWHIIDVYGPMETDTDVDVMHWPIVYVPAPDEVWKVMNFGSNGRPYSPMGRAIELCDFCGHLRARHLNDYNGACDECTKNCAGFVPEKRRE
jgi:hypothetical protein